MRKGTHSIPQFCDKIIYSINFINKSVLTIFKFSTIFPEVFGWSQGCHPQILDSITCLTEGRLGQFMTRKTCSVQRIWISCVSKK